MSYGDAWQQLRQAVDDMERERFVSPEKALERIDHIIASATGMSRAIHALWPDKAGAYRAAQLASNTAQEQEGSPDGAA